MAKKPTVYDVAKQAQVSIATVSRVLRTPENVRPATREAVQTAIRILNYVPSGSAQGLAMQKTGVIGMFLPGFDAVEHLGGFSPSTKDEALLYRDPPSARLRNPVSDRLYFDEVLRGSEIEAWHQGRSLLINIGLGHSEDDISSLVSDMAGKVDGMVVLARSIPDSTLSFLRKRIPIVMVATSPQEDQSSVDLVRVSNRKGMVTLVSHLIEAHEVSSFAYLAGPDDSPDNRKRYEGFQEALAAHGINPATAPIYRGQFRSEIAYSIVTDIAEDGHLPRALVCANDQMALGALRALDESGVDVPGKVIVTGFDDIRESSESVPRLTTVRQPMIDLGRAAVSVLSQRIENPAQPPISIELPVKVLLRESCEGDMSSICPESSIIPLTPVDSIP